jgi:hypothetical protein
MYAQYTYLFVDGSSCQLIYLYMVQCNQYIPKHQFLEAENFKSDFS